jgi:Uma2 family endonuclease
MSVVNPHIRFVYEDYKSLPESMTKRYELLDGEMLMVPAPTTTHQIISRNIEFLLHSFVRLHKLGTVLYAPVDVVFGAGNAREIVQPDVLYISRERGSMLVKEEIRGAPDLIVEVLSPGTEERDRTYKKHLYGRYGVREYWIVDPDSATIEVHVSAGIDFEHPTVYRTNDTLRSALFAGLDIDLQEVFDLR